MRCVWGVQSYGEVPVTECVTALCGEGLVEIPNANLACQVRLEVGESLCYGAEMLWGDCC